MTSKEKICLYCGRTFIPKNPKAYFCKTSHRVAFHKRKVRYQRREERKAAAKKMREEFLASLGIDEQELQEDITWLRQQQEKESSDLSYRLQGGSGNKCVESQSSFHANRTLGGLLNRRALKCLYCHKTFFARNSRAKFCSLKHRVAYFRLRQQFRKRQAEASPKQRQSLSPIALPDWSACNGKIATFCHKAGVLHFLGLRFAKTTSYTARSWMYSIKSASEILHNLSMVVVGGFAGGLN